jgi:DNA-binding transcriptional MerR regulator
MNIFTIKDLENLSGIKAHTIRIWEQRYNFLKPQRTATNIRYYSNEELKSVLNIALLNKYGYKISQIDRMQPEEISSKIMSLTDPRAVQERIVNELVQQMVDMDIDRFEKTLTGHILSKGMEKTITQIVFLYLEKIGLLWQTGHINPAQEHLVTNVIQQKIIAAIDSLSPVIVSDKTILLFLPEGEHHVMGLLYVYYLLKKQRVKVIYLGANIPLADVEYLVRIKKPDAAYMHLTSTSPGFNFEKFLQQFVLHLQGLPLVISGQITQIYKRPIPPSVEFKKSLSEVITHLSNF